MAAQQSSRRAAAQGGCAPLSVRRFLTIVSDHIYTTIFQVAHQNLLSGAVSCYKPRLHINTHRVAVIKSDTLRMLYYRIKLHHLMGVCVAYKYPAILVICYRPQGMISRVVSSHWGINTQLKMTFFQVVEINLMVVTYHSKLGS